jgi:hypothetical protein
MPEDRCDSLRLQAFTDEHVEAAFKKLEYVLRSRIDALHGQTSRFFVLKFGVRFAHCSH